MPKETIILGIDPGTRVTGYGVISVEKDGTMSFVACGAIKPRKKDLAQRLYEIQQGLRKLIKTHKPDFVAVEEVFFHKNARSALMIGEARAIALVSAAEAGVPVFNYPPAEVKKCVTGNGVSEKSAVRDMVKIHLRLNCLPEPLDASDALGIAICHCFCSASDRTARNG